MGVDFTSGLSSEQSRCATWRRRRPDGEQEVDLDGEKADPAGTNTRRNTGAEEDEGRRRPPPRSPAGDGAAPRPSKSEAGKRGRSPLRKVTATTDTTSPTPLVSHGIAVENEEGTTRERRESTAAGGATYKGGGFRG